MILQRVAIHPLQPPRWHSVANRRLSRRTVKPNRPWEVFKTHSKPPFLNSCKIKMQRVASVALKGCLIEWAAWKAGEMSVRVMGGDDGVTFIVCTICAPVGTFPGSSVSICLSSRSLQYHVFVRFHVNSCFYCAEWNSFWKRELRGWFQRRWGCFHLHGNHLQKCKVTL